MKYSSFWIAGKSRGPEKRSSTLQYDAGDGVGKQKPQPLQRRFALLGSIGILLLAQFAFARGPRVSPPASSDSFYPVAVWYGGGKARAPMLERVNAASPERWGKDLDQIKAVGFNTVKCWVDWATAEPKPASSTSKTSIS